MHRQIAGSLTGKVTKWLVLVAWLVVVGVSSTFAAKLADVQNNEASSWLPASAESTRALEKLGPFQDPNAIPTIVVYEREGGLTPDDLAAATAQVEELAALEGVEGEVIGPIPSEDGVVAQTMVTFNLGSEGWNLLPDTADDIREIAAIDGVNIYVAGAGGQAADAAEAFGGIDTTLLGATLGIVILILLFTYRSPILWILPIFSAVVALLTSQAVVYFLAKYADLTVNGQSYAILTILVIGAGTDYALLLVARYREELRRHEDRHEAMRFALHRAGPAIWASGSTVVAGLVCLLLASLNSTQGMGPACAIGVVVALLVMLTLLPALLVATGRWVFWPVRPAYGSPDHTETGLWARVGRRIARRPRTTWVVTTLLLGVATLGVARLDATGLENQDVFYSKPDSVVGEEVLSEHFPAGTGQPLHVVANADQAEEVSAAVAGTSGIAGVADPVVKGGTAWVAATLSDPPDTQAARDTVVRVREAVHAVDGADAQVGGGTAIVRDTLAAAERDNRVVIPAILLVVFLILAALLRALVAPVVLVATVVLSFFAALGLSALLFTHVFGFAGADPGMPLFVFVFLVALGIDYNIFLMTRVREEAARLGTRRGSLVALAATGGVITSAGLVLAGTFAALATLPVVTFAEIGIAVALGVLLDTIVVRAVLVTALNLDIGRRMWWPSRMWREDPDAVEETAEPVAQPARR